MYINMNTCINMYIHLYIYIYAYIYIYEEFKGGEEGQVYISI
jgi:hypothetical protein